MLQVAGDTGGSAALDPFGPDQDATSQIWTVEGLRDAAFRLALQYARAIEIHDDLRILEEVQALVHAGAAGAALLACAFACHARTVDWGPAVAVGPWAGSALVALCGGGLERFADCDDLTSGVRVAELVDRQRVFLELLAYGEAGAPGFLVCTVPAEHWADDFAALLPEVAVTAMASGGPLLRLRMAQAAVADLHIAPGSPEQEDAATIQVVPSATWRAFCLATSSVEQQIGSRIEWLDTDNAEQPLLALFHPALCWLDDLPPWARNVPEEVAHASVPSPLAEDGTLAPVATPDQSSPASSLLPEGLPRLAASVLQTRLAIVRQFVLLATTHPAPVWAAVLNCVAPTALVAAAADAVAAGIALLPPSVVAPVLSCQVEDRQDVIGVRCPLALVAGFAPYAVQTWRDYLEHGAPASFCDFVRRLPLVASDMPLLRRLVIADAFSAVHPKALLLERWEEIAAWCDDFAAGRLAPGVTVDLPLAQPSESPDAWSPPALEAVLQPVSDGAVPSSSPSDIARDSRWAAAARTIPLGGESVDLYLADPLSNAAPVRVALGGSLDSMGTQQPGDPEYIPIERDGAALWIASELVWAVVPGIVTIQVPLSGSEEADLSLIQAVRALVERHPGPHHATLELAYAGRHKVLPLDADVAWSADLRQGLSALLGTDAAVFSRPDEV
jgi:hypothetical protein